MTVECPYCEKPLSDEQAACCGEVGHGVVRDASPSTEGMNMNSQQGRAQSARKPRHMNWPSAADFAEGRVAHDWTGPDRTNVYVHCRNCGLIFKILEGRGPCLGHSEKRL